MVKKKGDSNYGADSISVLEGLEPVRKRPGMYIGSTGTDGLHTMVREIFDNSRDEAMGGYADRVEVAILPGEIIRVVDNGRGIPVDKHKKTGLSALDTIMESEAPASLIETLNQHMTKYLGVSWHEQPKAIEHN